MTFLLSVVSVVVADVETLEPDLVVRHVSKIA
jgi:hypothetical protein